MGFMKIIRLLKHDVVICNFVGDLLIIMETSQLLQFESVVERCSTVVKDNYLFTIDALCVFSFTSRLGLKDLYNKARIYILYNIKTLLITSRSDFFKLNEEDLLTLLNDDGLNVEDDEIDVFNLITEWCSKTDNHDMEYDMVIGCVRFSSMCKYQLQNCLLKTNNLTLLRTIRQYMSCTYQSEERMELLTRPRRSVPHVLCAMKNENEAAFIYRWDWTLLKFTPLVKVEPMLLGTTGYHVVAKGKRF